MNKISGAVFFRRPSPQPYMLRPDATNMIWNSQARWPHPPTKFRALAAAMYCIVVACKNMYR